MVTVPPQRCTKSRVTQSPRPVPNSFFGGEEGFEDAGAIALGDSGAAVLDGDDDEAGVFAASEADGSFEGRGVDGVGEEVGEHLSDFSFDGTQFYRLDVGFDTHAFLLCFAD